MKTYEVIVLSFVCTTLGVAFLYSVRFKVHSSNVAIKAVVGSFGVTADVPVLVGLVNIGLVWVTEVGLPVVEEGATVEVPTVPVVVFSSVAVVVLTSPLVVVVVLAAAVVLSSF